jgi:spore coat polysaccharide biosynthesis protein SpsF (cytidylyltransferase family)
MKVLNLFQNIFIILQSGKMARKIIALLQARTDSTRLPKKVLKKLLNKPMIIHQMQRTELSKLIDKLILVTSTEVSDDNLSNIVKDYGFPVFRGDKNNVLKRFYDSANELDLKDNDIIIRLTGDCPLHDSIVIDESIEYFLENNFNYLSNSVEAIYPDGLDVEVFDFKSLQYAHRNATLDSDLEHVTPYIRKSRNLKIGNLKKESIHSEWRLTVDEDFDFKLIENIYEYFNSTYFTFEKIVAYLDENPELLEINSNINRNEGYLKSLKDEENG